MLTLLINKIMEKVKRELGIESPSMVAINGKPCCKNCSFNYPVNGEKKTPYCTHGRFPIFDDTKKCSKHRWRLNYDGHTRNYL